ncbi:MerR family transcriptional regulator [Corynebacterium sp. TA-R-1]|uniref:MerR family transcriptional regulator n=1 Tax=Corynebacterium stercoris TaxID=2943490 RepID=A0ABT1G237_9CORY|nr:MerR family transcriptional regulator [Corynebacterium stercoris]
MKISEVAAAAGCSVRAIRHLHETGAVPEPARTSGNYRDYSAADLAAVLRARALIDAGVAVADIHRADAVERSISLLDDRISHLQQQRKRLLALQAAPLGVPVDVREVFLAAFGDSPYARAELEQFELMAVAGVATEATWQQLRANLTDPACVAATREFAKVWAGEMNVEKRKALLPQTVMRGVGETLKPGDLPLTPAEFGLRGEQRAALEALAGEFDA